MKPSPAFQFYPQDFLVGTADLTAEEVGGYIRLLCYQWAKGSLPNDDRKLLQLSGINDSLSLVNVSVKFRLCDDGFRRNDRLESVRKEQDDYRQKRSECGKKGGNPHFEKGKHNPYYNLEHKLEDKLNINPSSSSSSSNNTLCRVGAEEVLHYLNEKAGTHFRPVDGSLKHIVARLKEGGTVEQCKTVVDDKVKQWIGDPKMCGYLRPQTLFNSEKFHGYLGQIGVAHKSKTIGVVHRIKTQEEREAEFLKLKQERESNNGVSL